MKTVGNDQENPLIIFKSIFNSKSGMVKGSSVGKNGNESNEMTVNGAVDQEHIDDGREPVSKM